jgi:sugar phosphate isomerase/epimerase
MSPLAAAFGAGMSLDREIGITTASLFGWVDRKPGAKIMLLDLPRFVREELDMRVIDFNTVTYEGASRKELETLRSNAAKAGCVFTNLKMNQKGLVLDSADAATRAHAIATFKRSIDDAEFLGCRWARVLPLPERPHMQRYVAGLRELAEYTLSKKMLFLVENYGWMMDNENAIPELIQAIGMKVGAQPDTGNWNSNQIRYTGLAKAFKYAVSCDFKAKDLSPNGEHKEYDLQRCFEAGWKAGFRGPWCIEYANKDFDAEIRGLRILRDMLRGWMKNA